MKYSMKSDYSKILLLGHFLDCLKVVLLAEWFLLLDRE